MNKPAPRKTVSLQHAASRKPASARSSPASWLALSACIILIDQITKILAKNQIAIGGGIEISRYLNLVHVRNPGAAFSFLADAGGWQTWFLAGLAAIAAITVTVLLFKYAAQTLFALALSFILGGALGNLIDRIAYGAVIDFIDAHYDALHWPAFNVADIAISIGAALLVLDEILRVKRDKKT